MAQRRKISLIEEKIPHKKDVDLLTEWLLRSLGIIGKRDSGKVPSRILIELLLLCKQQEGASLEDISTRAKVSKTTTYHHISKMVKCGLVVKTKKGYSLKAHTLEHTIDEIEHEIHALLRRIRKIAEEIDREIE